MTFLRSLMGQITIVASLALAAAGWLWSHDHRVVKQERARVEAQGAQIDAKAQAARKRATSDADRVLGRYFRD